MRYTNGLFIFLSIFTFQIISPVQLVALAENAPAAAAPTNNDQNVFDLSLDQLINVEVTSAAKKTERIADAASAIYVLTSEDIRRSGETTIPGLLRMVPGLHVGQIEGSQWGVASRGFNGLFADKLLVLIDGRSVYTQLFGGVFWNQLDTIFEDIDRIEVIRGPGATLYGANAVNGVINIITKGAELTKGTSVRAGGGTQERGFGSVRFGDQTGNTSYRIYGKGFDRAPTVLQSTGKDGDDSWNSGRAGFRSDTILDNQRLTVQGDIYRGNTKWNPIVPTISGVPDLSTRHRHQNTGNILTRWSEEFSSTSDLMLQMYYDYESRDEAVLDERHHIVDFDSTYHFSPLSGHDVVSGLGYRVYRDSMDGSFDVSLDPEHRTENLYTGFIQDEITLISDELKLIVGTKLEHNDLSGLEVEPNIRMIGTPNESNSIWGAVSRAVRSPARFNHDGHIVLGVNPGGSTPGDQGLPTILTLNGQDGYDSSVVVAYELGYRAQVTQSLSFDVVTFYNDYTRLETGESSGAPFVRSVDGSPAIEVPFAVFNNQKGFTDGVEFVTDWKPTNWWRAIASYTFLNMNVRQSGDTQDVIYNNTEKQNPRNQFGVRSLMNLTSEVDLDTSLRYVSAVSAFDIGAYYEADVRVGWRVTKNTEVSVVGQNLLHKTHKEYASNLVDTQRSEIPRGVFAEVKFTF